MDIIVFPPVFPNISLKGLRMNKPSITIRMGAAHHDMTIADRGKVQVIDLAKLDRHATRKLRRMTVSSLETVGYFGAAA